MVCLTQHDFLIYINDRSNAEITHSTLIFTAVTQNHGDSRKSRHTTKIMVKVTVHVLCELNGDDDDLLSQLLWLGNDLPGRLDPPLLAALIVP